MNEVAQNIAFKETSPREEAAMLQSIGFWLVVREDYRQHKRSLSKPGFQALFAHRLGVYAGTLRFPLRPLWRTVAKLGQIFCRNFYGIELRPSANIGRRLEIGHQHGIVIHAHATIGDDCIIRQGVTFGIGTEWTQDRGPVIGDRVQFGVGSVVVGNVTIGDDVMIGPNCVIIRDVPSNSSVFVPPPRMIQRMAKVVSPRPVDEGVVEEPQGEAVNDAG